MFVILVRYENKKWVDSFTPWELCYGREGKYPYVGQERKDAEDYLFYLQSSFGTYEEKPVYKIMELTEVAEVKETLNV